MQKTVVLKFGGASVASPEHFSAIADVIQYVRQSTPRIAVVISAMQGMTDYLSNLAHQVNSAPPKREYDMLVSVGERISISLLAMALAKKGVEARSFTGSQSGIITSSSHSEAEVVEVRPHRLLKALSQEHIAIVAGFQGMSVDGEITTLGRGGSDTSAVVVARALEAEKVIFYKDVGAIYESDPKKSKEAKRLPLLTYQQLLDVMQKEKYVIHPHAVKWAMESKVPLEVRSFTDPSLVGTEIRGEEGCYAIR